MATVNIQMNMKNTSGTYDTLYPQTLGSQVSGTVSSATTASSCTGNAATATTLATSRTIRTNLASTSTASFNGSANITPGVTGVLPVANGGTGSSTEKYLQLTGGTLSGNLTLKGSGSYGTKINLGDGDYVHFSEPTDDCLEIKAKQVNFVLSNTSTSTQFTINGTNPFQNGNSGTKVTKGTFTGTGSTYTLTYPYSTTYCVIVIAYSYSNVSAYGSNMNTAIAIAFPGLSVTGSTSGSCFGIGGLSQQGGNAVIDDGSVSVRDSNLYFSSSYFGRLFTTSGQINGYIIIGS